MGDYIYCSIGSFQSERTMVGTMVSELGRDLLWIMKGKLVHKWECQKGTIP